MPQQVLVFLALSPSNCQLEEYNSYSNYGYNVYVIVDDNSFTPPSKYSHLCIQINDDQCIRRGFVNFNPAIRKHSRCSAWDKAVYALSYLICDYKQCWIIEEDVFIPSPGSLIGIDSDFPDADLLAESCIPFSRLHISRDKPVWPWLRHIPPSALLPDIAHGMVCACRLSNHLVAKVASFVEVYAFYLGCFNVFVRFIHSIYDLLPVRITSGPYEKFPFIEYIFHSIAISHGLKVCTPMQLSTISWRYDWSVDEIVSTNLYHPVKDIRSHPNIRSLVLSN